VLDLQHADIVLKHSRNLVGRFIQAYQHQRQRVPGNPAWQWEKVDFDQCGIVDRVQGTIVSMAPKGLVTTDWTKWFSHLRYGAGEHAMVLRWRTADWLQRTRVLDQVYSWEGKRIGYRRLPYLLFFHCLYKHGWKDWRTCLCRRLALQDQSFVTSGELVWRAWLPPHSLGRPIFPVDLMEQSCFVPVGKVHQMQPGEWGILYLQNDWTSVRPLPVDDVEHVFVMFGVGWFRLYGEYKDYSCKQRASTKNLGAGYEVTWRSVLGKESVELASIHWCFCPSITRLDIIPKLFSEPIVRESDVIRRSARLPDIGARVVDNVMFHVGIETTPGGKFGRPRSK